MGLNKYINKVPFVFIPFKPNRTELIYWNAKILT